MGKSKISRSEKRRNRRLKSPGMSPGSLIFEGEQYLEKAQLSYVRYDSNNIKEVKNASLDEIKSTRSESGITWVQCLGISDVNLIKALGDIYRIDPLTLEDIVSPHIRPKVEDFSEYVYFGLKQFVRHPDREGLELEQISIVMGANFVITFHERSINILTPIFKRLNNTSGRIRSRNTDYLVFAIIDNVVDHYFPILDGFQQKLYELDEVVVLQNFPGLIHELHSVKREIAVMLRTVVPFRDVMNYVMRADESPFLNEDDPYLRDIYDHVLEVIDSLESSRDHANTLIDTHFSLTNSRTNEVIRFLTIITSVFIPLTFVTSIYGMNFKFMPELEWRYGYPTVLIIMLAMFLGFTWYCRKKNWI
jgi:magnesium transporter